MVVWWVENESQLIDKELLERFENNNLGLRHVSFKLSTEEGIINAIRMNFHRDNQLRLKAQHILKLHFSVRHAFHKMTPNTN